ncbi:RNA 2',3'-cyclic phosphodiesterase [Halomonas sp. TRM85114]|uniref:RNA 2',3'-cyclic phosphodiesterase n=1 Tax=Halomonas jincaotanensis TaxID=2810616 RepID=UPI001BD1FEF1|nr:RNA 2',3'-cyclic phosphodiesterase [Halomonas jincaotanensis]MBS9403312.1 RNA 2',3'-cyclic phosphodiesterase [Halomonas jincaotanensis]
MRLFLALTPPPELRTRFGELADLAQARCGGRRIPDANLHLTLAFLGEVSPTRLDSLAHRVRQLKVQADSWTLDEWGCFRSPRIVWIGGARPDPALQRLHSTLWQELAALGFEGGPSRYIPHLTLLRRAERLDTPKLPAFRIDWPYCQVELVHSVTGPGGSRYTTLARSRAVKG